MVPTMRQLIRESRAADMFRGNPYLVEYQKIPEQAKTELRMVYLKFFMAKVTGMRSNLRASPQLKAQFEEGLRVSKNKAEFDKDIGGGDSFVYFLRDGTVIMGNSVDQVFAIWDMEGGWRSQEEDIFGEGLSGGDEETIRSIAEGEKGPSGG